MGGKSFHSIIYIMPAPLSFRESVLWVWCCSLFMFRNFLKPFTTCALPSWRSAVIFTVCQYICLFIPFDSNMARVIYCCLCNQRIYMAVCQLEQPIPCCFFFFFFHQVLWVIENNGVSKLCNTLGGQLLYCMCNFYGHGQTVECCCLCLNSLTRKFCFAWQ